MMCTSPTAVRGQQQEGSKEPAAKARASQPANRAATPQRKLPRPTAEMQKVAMEFASEHVPELAKLLPGLRKKSRPDFDSAIREMHSTAVRLERLKTREPERYRVDLEAWKLDKSIQLMAARLSMTHDPEIQEQILTAIRKRTAIKKRQIEFEIERYEVRLDRLKASHQEISASPEEIVERDFRRIQNMVKARDALEARKQAEAEQNKQAERTKPQTRNPKPVDKK